MYDCLTRYFTAKTRGQNESDLNMEWRLVSDSLGRATRAALLRTSVTNVAAKATQPRKLELIETYTLGHYDLVVQAWLPRRTGLGRD